MSRTLWVSIPNGTVVTSFLMSGALEQWRAAGINVVVFAPPHARQALERHYAGDGVRFEILEDWAFGRSQVICWSAAQAVLSRCKDLISVRLGEMYDCAVRGFRGRVRWTLWRSLPGWRWLQTSCERRVRRSVPDLYKGAFDRSQPDLVFLNDPYQTNEMALCEAARRRGIRTVVMSHSWDNITSRGLLRARADHLLVWNPVNREEALRIHDGYAPDDVTVTGVPLFDIYADPGIAGDRETFFREAGLDPDKKLILYTGITERGCPFSAQCDIVEAVAEAVNDGRLPPSNILFRVHPKAPGGEELQDWADRLGITLHVPRGNNRFDDGWVPQEDDLVRLARTVAHADVSINMASTLLIHAAILKVPCVCPRHDGRKVYPYARSLRRGYDYEHNRKILELGYADVVDDDEAMIGSIREALASRDWRPEARARLLERYAPRLGEATREATRVITGLVGG